MKTIFKYLIFLIAPLFLWCCEDEPTTQPTESAEYYVKYEATVQPIHYAKIENIKYTVSTEKGLQTFSGSGSFSVTFGPFEKGFTANFTVKTTTSGNASCSAFIYVCRGNEPFALKATESGGNLVSTSYKIDF